MNVSPFGQFRTSRDGYDNTGTVSEPLAEGQCELVDRLARDLGYSIYVFSALLLKPMKMGFRAHTRVKPFKKSVPYGNSFSSLRQRIKLFRFPRVNAETPQPGEPDNIAKVSRFCCTHPITSH